MRYLLNVAYLLVLIVLSPWLIYTAIRKGEYRSGWAAKIFGRVPLRTGQGPCVWLHAVSVGEVNMLAPLLIQLEREHPGLDCVISTTRRTGYLLARQKYAPRPVFYCPLDFSWAVRRAMRCIRPNLLVLTESELWPNLILAARQHGAQVAVINGRISQRSARNYAYVRGLTGTMLRRLNLIAVQNEEYARRFLELGACPTTVRITGSIKFDHAQTDRENPRTRQLAALAGIRQDDIVFLAGSTQDPEEQMALDTYRELSVEFPGLRLIITPRHPERFETVAKLLDRSQVQWQRRSELQAGGEPSPVRILLVDSVGELGFWWGTARIAFVGGSMGRRGGQNMIEPAAYGAAVCFGPHTRNFRDVVELLLDNDAATVIRNQHELNEFVRRCLAEPPFAAGLGTRASGLVGQQRGACERTCRLLGRLLEPSGQRRDET
jgi:3-deoxy-D-manno-octulosonic-acid transferase